MPSGPGEACGSAWQHARYGFRYGTVAEIDAGAGAPRASTPVAEALGLAAAFGVVTVLAGAAGTTPPPPRPAQAKCVGLRFHVCLLLRVSIDEERVSRDRDTAGDDHHARTDGGCFIVGPGGQPDRCRGAGVVHARSPRHSC